MIQDRFIRRRVSDKVLCNKAFMISKNPNYDRYKCELVSMVYKFFHQKASGGVVKSEIMPNQQSVKELHNPVIRIFGFLI